MSLRLLSMGTEESTSLNVREHEPYLERIDKAKKKITVYNGTEHKSYSPYPKVGEAAKIFLEIFHDPSIWLFWSLTQRKMLFQRLNLETRSTVINFNPWSYGLDAVQITSADISAKARTIDLKKSENSPFATYYKMLTQNPNASYENPIIRDLQMELTIPEYDTDDLVRYPFSNHLEEKDERYERANKTIDFSKFLTKHEPIRLIEMIHAIRDDQKIKPDVKQAILGSLLFSLKGYPESPDCEQFQGLPSDPFLLFSSMTLMAEIRKPDYLAWFPPHDFDLYYREITKYVSVEKIEKFLLDQYLYKVDKKHPTYRPRYVTPEIKKLLVFYWERLFKECVNFTFKAKPASKYEQGQQSVILPFDAEIITEAAEECPRLGAFYFEGYQISEPALEILKKTNKLIFIDRKIAYEPPVEQENV